MLSIIIPYYNRALWLPRCLHSLEALREEAVELILVNNNSTDASEKFVQTWKEERMEGGKAAVVLLSCAQQGANFARNVGAQKATGDYFYFFDSDDVLEPAFLHLALEHLEAHADCDAVAARTRMVFPDGRVRERRSLFTQSAVDQILSGMFSTQSLLMRRETYEKTGGWDETLSTWDDWELFTRLLFTNPRIFWIRHRAFHRLYQHADSHTGASFRATLPAIHRALLKVEQLAAAHHDPQALRALAARRVILAAALQHEGAREEARLMKKETFSAPNAPRLRLHIIFLYARIFRFGAWRVARALL